MLGLLPRRKGKGEAKEGVKISGMGEEIREWGEKKGGMEELSKPDPDGGCRGGSLRMG